MKVEFTIQDPYAECALKEMARRRGEANPEYNLNELCEFLVNSHPETQAMLNEIAESMFKEKA